MTRQLLPNCRAGETSTLAFGGLRVNVTIGALADRLREAVHANA